MNSPFEKCDPTAEQSATTASDCSGYQSPYATTALAHGSSRESLVRDWLLGVVNTVRMVDTVLAHIDGIVAGNAPTELDDIPSADDDNYEWPSADFVTDGVELTYEGERVQAPYDQLRARLLVWRARLTGELPPPPPDPCAASGRVT